MILLVLAFTVLPAVSFAFGYYCGHKDASRDIAARFAKAFNESRRE